MLLTLCIEYFIISLLQTVNDCFFMSRYIKLYHHLNIKAIFKHILFSVFCAVYYISHLYILSVFFKPNVPVYLYQFTSDCK